MRSLVALIAFLLATTQPAGAAEWNSDPAHLASDYAQRIERLETELAALRAVVDPSLASAACQHDCGPPCAAGCCDSWGWYGGASVLLMKPHFKESYEAVTINALTSSQLLLPFEYDFNANLRLRLGYVGESGLGGRVTYTDFGQQAASQALTATATTAHQAQVVTINIPAVISTLAPGDLLATRGRLDTQTVDFDGTLHMAWNDVEIVVAGGLRYASFDQSFAAEITGVVPQTLNWERSFEGIGPTLAADARVPLIGGLSLVGGGRGALLFGSKSLTRSVSIVGAPLPQPTNNIALIDADEITPTLGLTLGMEWERRLSRSRFFARGAYEAELWAESGAPTLGYLGFEGFTLTVGIDH